MLLMLAAGCQQKPVHFPSVSLEPQAKAVGALAAYDTDNNGKADFFVYADPHGRINRIAYAYNGEEKPQEIVNLDVLDRANFRHVVIILDGFGYDVVKQYCDEGGLRYCYPPSRVIAPYPTLTDLAMEDVLGYLPCKGYEAEYFDREKNAVVGGKDAYLSGENEPYARLLQYRASFLVDAVSYLAPNAVFGKELNDAMRVYHKAQTQEMIAYFVSSAGIGTRQGAQGQRQALVKVDQFVNQLIWQTHGIVRVTILSDHGHSYTPAARIGLEDYLQAHGWRLTEHLNAPRDVAYIRFGLVTFAAFSTHDSPALAADLVGAKGVELASFVQNDTVVVLGQGNSKALISRKGDLYRYEAVSGDPLRLKDLLKNLHADSEGYCKESELFDATVTHYYPDALQRLWRAHFDMVENPANVLVSLEDSYYSGSRGFDKFVDIASTHGGLNARNSTAFIMSTIAPLPPAMQSKEIPQQLKKITGHEFPWRR
jgi:hypothetical protein